jgi:hypothetical protein
MEQACFSTAASYHITAIADEYRRLIQSL